MLKLLRQVKRRYLDKPMHFLRAYRAADPARRRRLKAVFRRYWPLPKWRPWKHHGIWLYCDYPHLQERVIARLTGTVEFRGWAVATGGIASVTLFCDGQLLAEATYGCRRPDVLRLGIPRAYRSGFMCHIDTRKIPAGNHQLTITARSKDGAVASITRPVRVLPQPTDYERWRYQHQPTAAALAWMKRNTGSLDSRPRLSLAMTILAEPEPNRIVATLQSLKSQAYLDWELVVACDRQFRNPLEKAIEQVRGPDDRIRVEYVQCCTTDEARNVLLERATGDWFGPIDAGDVLEPQALFEFVYHSNRHPEYDLLYCDEDAVGDMNVRCRPFFKPDWSPDLLLSFNYLGRLWLARTHLVREAGGFRPFSAPTSEYDLLLRLTESAEAIGHLRTVLYGGGSTDRAAPADAGAAVREALERRQIQAEVLPGQSPGTWRVKYSLSDQELVSVIVPLNGDRAAFETCIESIRAKTSYQNYEIVVPHQPSELPSDLQTRLEWMGIKLVACEHTATASQVLNTGAAEAGKYLLFVRDVRVITPDWIETLLQHAQRPDVAAAGARLLGSDGCVQHAGYFLVDSVSGARSSFRSSPHDDWGYFGLAGVPRECSAVSSAALMVRRDVFEELCGFDERLAGTQRDVDFCLHARQHGYRVITTPYAVLSAEPPEGQAALAAQTNAESYWERWQHTYEIGDPYYNPNLTVRRDDYSLNEEPVLLTHASASVIDPAGIERILVIKLDHLGDLVLTLPAIRRLRQLFPAAEITALVGSWAGSFIQSEPSIDRVLTYDVFYQSSAKPSRNLSHEEQLQIWRWLSSHGFDLAIDFRRESNTRAFLALSGARYTASFTGERQFDAVTLTVPWDPRAQRRQSRRHITQDPLGMVDVLAAACRSEVLPDVGIPDPGQEIDDLLAPLPAGDGPILGIHPGAGREIKCWAPEEFARFADLMKERLGARVMLFGGPGDEALVENILRHMRHRSGVLSLAGRLTIPQFVAAVRRCDLFVGNDSGPSHLAGAAGVPTLAVYAGTIDPVQWGPMGPNAVAIYRGMLCAPCYFSEIAQCAYHVACLRRLPVEQVWEAALRTMLPRWPDLRRRCPDVWGRLGSFIAEGASAPVP